ncbi:MAG: hypothetical protein ACREKS_16390 [Candidatus Rokuibacteriota bacterium]
MSALIAIVGDFDQKNPTHAFTNNALDHARMRSERSAPRLERVHPAKTGEAAALARHRLDLAATSASSVTVVRIKAS